MRSLAGRRALVTGAAAGLGRAIATELVASGVAVVCVDIDGPRLDDVVADLGATGEAWPIRADLRDRCACVGAVEWATRLAGPPDILVNNAGLSLHQGHESMAVGTARDLFALNFFAPVQLALSVLPAMVARRSGSIINISSVAGYIPTPLEATYGASKAALWRWSHNADMELRDAGVRVCTLSPGPMDTEMWDKDGSRDSYGGKLHPPEVVAHAAVRLVTDPHAQRTFPRRFGFPGALYGVAGGPTRWALRRFASRHSQPAAPLPVET